VAILPLLALVIVVLTRPAPIATASLSSQNSPVVDIQQMHKGLIVKALPNGDVDEGNSAD
jgi:hypothetical protein